MIIVSENIKLRHISSSETKIVFNLMNEIYPPAYKHFWIDEGEWYVNTQYSKENITKEIAQENAAYYFVVYNDEIIGNLRILWDEKLAGISAKKQVKLHRIYLHQKVQGKGLGKILLNWLEQNAKTKGYKIIWLDAMDAQPQAFQFYKNLGYEYHSHTFLPFKLMHNKVRKMSQVYKNLH